MGRKVHPIGFRLGYIKDWQSKWFADRTYTDQLHEDFLLRKLIVKELANAGVARVKIECSARLGGAEMARIANESDGRVPRHTLRADIDYATVHAHTTYGRIGVKVWIYKGEVFPDAMGKLQVVQSATARPQAAEEESRPRQRSGRGGGRNERGDRGGGRGERSGGGGRGGG